MQPARYRPGQAEKFVNHTLAYLAEHTETTDGDESERHWFDEQDDDEQYDEDEETLERLELGPCCACGVESRTVRNIVTLHFKGPTPGHGWGCLQCGLSTDGACCVLCDDCVEKNADPKYACAGYPGEEGRVPIESLTEPFDHNMECHMNDEHIVPYEEDDDDF